MAKLYEISERYKNLENLLDNPDMLKSLRKKAFDYGRTITWP